MTCHDLSDGGLALALAEMCLANGLGAEIELEGDNPHAKLFGEDQARYILTVDEEWADMFAANSEGSGVAFTRLGKVGGDTLNIGNLISISLAVMRETHEAWFPNYMAHETAAE